MIILKIFVGCILIILVTFCVLLLFKANQVNAGRKKVKTLLERSIFPKLEYPGSVDNLMVLPLIDFFAEPEGLETEPGVSYLVKADNTTILMDVGFNRQKSHPSPLLKNMKALNVNITDIDMIFISHVHPDHVGGMSGFQNREFSISLGLLDIGAIPVFSPGPLKPSKWNPRPIVEIVSEPKIIAPGIATLGTIPRFLFLFGKTDEQVLAVNLKGKGIVLIVGCGHPTIEKIIARTRMVFDQPIYAIIGGLHFPVKGGRSNIGPFNIQYIVGSDRPPWNGVNEDDVNNAIRVIQKEQIKIISLSPHDSSDWSLEKFKNAFPGEWKDLLVGRQIKL